VKVAAQVDAKKATIRGEAAREAVTARGRIVVDLVLAVGRGVDGRDAVFGK